MILDWGALVDCPSLVGFPNPIFGMTIYISSRSARSLELILDPFQVDRRSLVVDRRSPSGLISLDDSLWAPWILGLSSWCCFHNLRFVFTTLADRDLRVLPVSSIIAEASRDCLSSDRQSRLAEVLVVPPVAESSYTGYLGTYV